MQTIVECSKCDGYLVMTNISSRDGKDTLWKCDRCKLLEYSSLTTGNVPPSQRWAPIKPQQVTLDPNITHAHSTARRNLFTT